LFSKRNLAIIAASIGAIAVTCMAFVVGVVVVNASQDEGFFVRMQNNTTYNVYVDQNQDCTWEYDNYDIVIYTDSEYAWFEFYVECHIESGNEPPIIVVNNKYILEPFYAGNFEYYRVESITENMIIIIYTELPDDFGDKVCKCCPCCECEC